MKNFHKIYSQDKMKLTLLKSVIKKKFEDKKDLVDKEKKIDFLSNTLKLYNLRKFMSSFFQIKKILILIHLKR